MTLRHFQIFKTVCNEESITLAAEKMNMTQPAVSIAIKELESFYKVKLFERMNRRIFITEAGHCLLQYADTVLSQFEESISVIRDAAKFNKCCFGANVTIGETRLALLVKKITAAFPDYRIKAIVKNSREIEQMLLRNDIDFAVVDSVSTSANLKITRLFKRKMVAVCNPSYTDKNEMTLKELSQERLLLREEGSCTRTCSDAVFEAKSLPVTPFIESVSTFSLTQCAENGLGITILPEIIAKPAVAKGTLKIISISDAVFEREYLIIRHKNKYLTNCMNNIIDLIKTELI